MAKIFYDHLIDVAELTAEFTSLDNELQMEMESLIHETIHHHVIDVILTSLPEKHHQEFLIWFHASPHDPKLLLFLKNHVPGDIEGIIAKRVTKVKKNLLTTIKKSKHKSSF